MNNHHKYSTGIFNLEEESRNKWINSLETIQDDSFLFILDWVTLESICYGIGVEPTSKKFVKFKTTVEPIFYVWARDLNSVTNLLVHATSLVNNKQPIIQCSEKLYKNNQSTMLDDLLKNTHNDATWKMYAIPMFSFKACKKLHGYLNNNTTVLYNVSTTACWSTEILLMLTMHTKYPNRVDIPIFSKLINRNLEYDEITNFEPNLDVMVFDIETVSHEDHRLPMGDYATDCMSSVTIVKYSTSKNIYEIETLFNIPIDDANELKEAKDIIQNHTKPYRYVTKRTTEIVNNEIDLLQKTLAHFLDPRFEMFVLLGFNSKYYDMSFLLRRATYLCLSEIEHFYYIHGIVTYGNKMIHIDMQQVIQKYYRGELSSFALKNVAKDLLEHVAKVDFNARYIRYIYNYFIEEKTINHGKFSSELCKKYTGAAWSVDLETLAYYNDMDSIVVLSLWLELQYEPFLLFVTRDNFMPLSRIAQTGVSEYLNTNIIFEGIKRNIVCTNHFHQLFTHNSDMYIHTNLNVLASSNDKESAGYGGGFNFRYKKEHLSSVAAMDAQAYYPEIIAGFNLSHETTILFTVQGLLEILKRYPDIEINFKLFRFCTHKNIIPTTNIENLDLLDNMSSKAYVFNFHDNGSEISISDLPKLSPNERLLMISNKTGLLSTLITHRNYIRNIAKSTKKNISLLIEESEELIGLFEIEEAKKAGIIEGDEDEEEEMDFDNIDLANMDEEDDGPIEMISFNIEDYKIQQGSTPEEEYMIKPHYKSLSKSNFKNILDKTNAIKLYIQHLKRDFIRVNSQYRNMKLVNNSIYGLLGSQFGALKGKSIAAAATMIGRKYIIEAAKIGHSINCRCVYSDTDSVFISTQNSTHETPVKYIIDETNNLNKHLILNAKIYQDIFIIAKKKYIAYNNYIFSRGINKNGPALWNQQIYGFYTKYICEKTPIYMKDVFHIMYNMYIETYKQLTTDPSLVLCSMHIMALENYKTNTPAKRLIERISVEIPSYKIGNKISYFNVLRNAPTTTYLGLDIELQNTPLKEINLYQFYSKISKTLFDIISYSISRTNLERNLYTKYPSTTFKHENLCAFVKANSTIV